MRDEIFYNRVGADRISDRHVNELIGIARGLCADEVITDAEVRFLEKWLMASLSVATHPSLLTLFDRIQDVLTDDHVSEDERHELFDTLNSLTNNDFELGESLKSATLPLCDPAPAIQLLGKRYTFTGTFNFGKRQECEVAMTSLGATHGPLSRKTRYLVVGAYATESWKFSSFGNKILQAVEWRSEGHPISIVSEQHWSKLFSK